MKISALGYRSIKSLIYKLIFIKKTPLPWLFWKLYQKSLNCIFGNKADTLVPTDVHENYKSSLLDHEIKATINLNTDNEFTLSAVTLNFIWKELKIHRPTKILEFGSGLSTRLILDYFRQFNSGNGLLISIDQDNFFLEESVKNVDLHHVVYIPLVFKVTGKGYLIDEEKINKIVHEHGLIDFIVIDGPYGQWMSRERTLPEVIKYCRNDASWYMDDALRDSELEVIKKWKREKGVRINGILPINKGMALGKIKRGEYE